MSRGLCLAMAFAALASPALAAGPVTPKAVVEAKFAAVNRHDLAAVVASYAPDARLTAADFCKPRLGRADVERTYRAIFAAAPDVSVELTDTVAQGDRVAVRFVLRSQQGGRTYELPIMNFFTVEHGLITRDDGMFDNHGRACTP